MRVYVCMSMYMTSSPVLLGGSATKKDGVAIGRNTYLCSGSSSGLSFSARDGVTHICSTHNIHACIYAYISHLYTHREKHIPMLWKLIWLKLPA